MKNITEVAKEFNISSRTIRYYEEIGLLSLTRTSTNQRLFTKEDMAKIKLILRGKKFGFTLDEIKEMVLLFDQDRTGKRQLKRTIEYGKDRMNEIDEKITELMEMKTQMESLLVEFTEKLNSMEEE
ncbi:MerR family transcriptional regulator [Bacillus sp. AK128]